MPALHLTDGVAAYAHGLVVCLMLPFPLSGGQIELC